MIGKVRTIETPTSEVYVDINDLIIEILLEVDRCQTDHEKESYRLLAKRLCDIRDKGHRKEARNGTKTT